MFLFKKTAQNNSIIFENGETRIINAPEKHTQACAIFHPTNADRVYIFGGYKNTVKSNQAIAYHFEDDTYHQLSNMPYVSISHTCQNYVKSNGNAVSFIFFLL